MSTHGHSAHNTPGSKADKHHRGDGSGPGNHAAPSNNIGHPFVPMVQTAPIHGFFAHHYTVACPACSVPILWVHATEGTGACAGCKTRLVSHPETGHPMVA